MSVLRQQWTLLRGLAGLCLLLTALPLLAGSHHTEAWAKAQFAKAEKLRTDLNQAPAKERTRRDYQKVISAYRLVYYGSPTSTKADPSVVAVAQLQLEMGRRFSDDRLLRLAVKQYEFLRKEYPGSGARFEALLTIGQIYQDDLHDSARAKAAFEEFLRRYPNHHLADDARKALAAPEQQAAVKPAAPAKDVPAKEISQAKQPAADDDADNADDADSPDSGAAKETRLSRVTGIRHWSTPDYTRVAIDLDQAGIDHDLKFDSQRIDHPDRIFFDLTGTKLAAGLSGKAFDVDDGLLKKIRVAQFQPGQARIVLEVDDLADYNAFLLPNPSRLIIDIHGKDLANKGSAGPVKADTKDVPAAKITDDAKAPAASVPVTAAGKSGPTDIKKKVIDADDDDATPVAKVSDRPAAKKPGVTQASKKSKITEARNVHEAKPNANGDRSLIRALGLKIGKIVIDPGHGGHDTGTIGPKGFEEKDLVLDVSLRLGKLLETRLGSEVRFTRDDDTFIPLETRTAIANQAQADLFVSIHANSSHDPDARGVETYYLNFTSSPEALDVAARENAVSQESIYQLQDLVKKIALKEKIEESREFAADVQESLHSGLAARSSGIRNRGVKKAPFIVLIGANMPSILAEISFVSNPEDERKLRTADYRQKIAESLYRGIAKYVGGLSGVKVASEMQKGAGQ